MYKEDLALNNLQWLICHKNSAKQNHIYLIYVYKEDLALNNLQWLICHKNSAKQNHIYLIYVYKEDLALKKTCSGWYAIKPNQTRSYLFDIYVSRLCGIKWPTMVDMP